MREDRGRIVIGTITRIAGCLAVIVVLFHDGIVMGLGQVAAQQDAQVAAQAGAQDYLQTHDVQKAYEAAALAVASRGTDVDPASFKVDPSAQTVTLGVSRDTSTMVADRISWLDPLTHPHAQSSVSFGDR